MALGRSSLVLAGSVCVARAKRLFLSRFELVAMAPDAPGVVREQVDRDRRLLGRGANAVDVVVRRDQRVEVARDEWPPLRQLELAAAPGENLLVLGALVEADEAPREVVVNR